MLDAADRICNYVFSFIHNDLSFNAYKADSAVVDTNVYGDGFYGSVTNFLFTPIQERSNIQKYKLKMMADSYTADEWKGNKR